MVRQMCTGAAVGVVLLGSAALVSAQQGPDKGGEPSVRERTPQGKELREAPGAQQQPGGSERPKAMDQPGRDRPQGVERPDRDRPKGAERPDWDRPKTTDRPDQDRPKGAERPDRTRPGIAQPDVEKGAPARVQLSDQQRNDIGAKLRQTRVEKTRVQVNVNIGSRVPRSVRLRPLPNAVFAAAPAYRSHSYFVLEDDTIVIVDERTYVIIDVIPVTTRVAGLSLSTDQMRFIFARVPRDRTVDIRVRLALGAEVPRNVELLPFPPEVVARIPELESYRYVVANRDVAIVDPRDGAVLLVISE